MSSNFNDLNKGSVCALYLLHDFGHIVLFCSLNILLDLEHQTSMEYWIQYFYYIYLWLKDFEKYNSCLECCVDFEQKFYTF